MITDNLKPLLVLDFKKKRIRIHKITLKMLHNPEYIQILINPEEKLLLIISEKQKDHLAHKINYEKLKRDCFEIYSMELINAIYAEVPEIKREASYKLIGELVPNHCLAKFVLTTAQVIEHQTNKKDYN